MSQIQHVLLTFSPKLPCPWNFSISVNDNTICQSPQLQSLGVIIDSSSLHTQHPMWQQILLALSSKSKYKLIISHDSTATTPVQITITSCLEYWNSFWSTVPCFYPIFLLYSQHSSQSVLFKISQVMSLLHSKSPNASPFYSKQDPKTWQHPKKLYLFWTLVVPLTSLPNYSPLPLASLPY